MNSEYALNIMLDYDIKKHCHVNTNEDGDRFVGIKVDSDNFMIYFPIGYRLAENDNEIRIDINHLIQVLSEFTTKEERLIAVDKFAISQNVDFPINAYRNVIEYYFSIGGTYYVEKESSFITATIGKQDWARTIRKHIPFAQSRNNVSSFIYTRFEVCSSKNNDNKEITQINKFCVYEAFKRLGWLYVPYMPEKPGIHPDLNTSIIFIRKKLFNTNDDRKRILFQSMIDMLEYMDEQTSDKQIYYGTDNFDHVWEKLIDRAFGEKNKEDYFPHSRWLLEYGENKEKRPLMPDTIMIYNSMYYILDAKYYKYGVTGVPDHLPNASSINKQITYGEYMEKYKGINKYLLFNAFIMPYNMSDNPFGLKSVVGNIGEAVGDWKLNEKYYERIQGIVIDTKYLMYHYLGNTTKEKEDLAECIESILKRRLVTISKEEPIFYSKVNTSLSQTISLIAEDAADYESNNKKI